mmetsp:Transcript_58370/g.166115  ORF Transcript_58370/g.166115 Transcript_58370/m.166115 type:complete len:227 (+) Transcript_58370:839-1519(+)
MGSVIDTMGSLSIGGTIVNLPSGLTMTTEWIGWGLTKGVALQPQAVSSVAWTSSALAPSRMRWMGSKTTPSSCRFWSSTRAKRAGCVSLSIPAWVFRFSQQLLAVASEWFPSPMRMVDGLRFPASAAANSFAASAFIAEATCSVPFGVTVRPFTEPAPLKREHSYSGVVRPSVVNRGSITVLPGSSMIMMMWGSSSGASLRMAMRGGSRATMVFSVGRMSVGSGQL